MDRLPPDSAELHSPSEPPDSAQGEQEAEASLRYARAAVLFTLTVLSVFFAGGLWCQSLPVDGGWIDWVGGALAGWPFAVPLLSILLVHELGHFVAARIHRVEASLPYFIPAPFLSPFGTMGAVIAMRGRIRSRDALLDIGASGPLAGLVVALPVLAIGIHASTIEPLSRPYLLEGQSLLYLAMKRVFAGPIPDGHDLTLSPIALAGWTGLLVTMLNLVPVGQLDGGHVAYALFGPRQNHYARVAHLSLLLVALFNLVRFVGPHLVAGHSEALGAAIGNSTFWLVWFGLLALMRRLAGGENHPPTDPGELSPKRRIVAIGTLSFFVLLFMPTPWSSWEGLGRAGARLLETATAVGSSAR
jgi:membrane-associated protease RseP (regulator of RpoE activity)